MGRPVKGPVIGVDAMGGDLAPRVVIEGALEALREADSAFDVALIGDEAVIIEEAERLGVRDKLPRIVHAAERVEMAEAAASSVRRKRDSSISVSARLQKEHQTDALVSAGNTGAVVAAALFELGRIESIQRPAIATVLPTPQGNVVVLDVGATSDCKPYHLYQFALMGSIYARLVLHVERPRVGLLNIGEEAEKGSELYYEAHQLLKRSPVHFAGNVEGRDIILGTADVVVCDGFVGNVLLKFAESVIPSISSMIKDEIARHPLSMMAGLLLKPAFHRLRRRLDYAEVGGAPLLGVDGTAIIAHGRSNVRAIKNAIRVAARCAEAKVPDSIRTELQRLAPEAA
ncbi:MAG: phosphate acyltransferase PlsX [Candidatus Eisenbacteria bacterium]|uniref:Phosphate acyltransferase n=1 Tax=Eiseniibacteriota bacterium TaxID=2212470 RepID=A0A538TMF3_UNCEI|nr:MAG: phosphate acyltransferase PlsX [Candidatus Eisenbacteria bacterium]